MQSTQTREYTSTKSGKIFAVLFAGLTLVNGCGKSSHSRSRAVDFRSASIATEGTAEGQMRRLSKIEIDNSVISMLGDNSHLALLLPPDEDSLGYTNGYNLRVTQLFLDQWQLFAGQIAAQAVKSGSPMQKENAACLLAHDSQWCAEDFIRSVGKQAFRRPLSEEELKGLHQVFNAGQALGSYNQGAQVFIEALLMSPSFLYRTELGTDNAQAGLIYELNSYELASQLSYSLTAYPPDAALMAAADANTITSASEYEAQARRLLASDHARGLWRNFVFAWLKIGAIDSIQRNHSQWSDDLPKAFRTETEDFVDYMMTEGQGSLPNLLNADYSFLDSRLTKIYGLGTSNQTEFALTKLNSGERRGILNQGSFLSVHAQIGGSSPVKRGVVILERLFCQTLPPPPPGVAMVPAETPNGTTRDRFAAHSANRSCQGCHNLIDPLGFAFENFDGLGLYRSQENDHPIDASGVLKGHPDTDGPFRNGPELIERLASSKDVHECVATQLFRYAMGRRESDSDASTIADSLAAAEVKNMDLREALLSIVSSSNFKQRLRVEP